MSGKKRILLALATLLLLRLMVVLAIGRPWSAGDWFDWVRPVKDSNGYMALAEDLTDFSVDEPSFRTPGYPVFLLLTGSTRGASPATILLQQLVSLCTALLIWGTVSRLGFRGGGVAAVYYMMLPADVVAASRLLPDNLLAAAAALSGYMLVRGLTSGNVRSCLLWSYLAGFAVSFATIVKPSAIFMPAVVLVPVILFRRGYRLPTRLFSVLLLLAASISLPTAWRSMNHIRFGLDAISTQQGFETMGRVAVLTGRATREEVQTTFQDSLTALATAPDGTTDWSARDSIFRGVLVEEFRRQPLRVILPHLAAWPRIISSNIGNVFYWWGLPAEPGRLVTVPARALVVLYNLLPFAGMLLAFLRGRGRPGVRTALMLGLLMWGYTSLVLGPLGAAGARYWLLALWAVTVAGATGLDYVRRSPGAATPPSLRGSLHGEES